MSKLECAFCICAYAAVGSLGLYLAGPEMPDFQSGMRMFLSGWMFSAIVGIIGVRPSFRDVLAAREARRAG